MGSDDGWVLPKPGNGPQTRALTLADRRVRLAPATPGDAGFITRTLDQQRQVSHDWPRPGAGPAGAAGPSTARYYVAHSQASGEPIGVALGYDINERHGRAYAGVVLDPAHVGGGLGMSILVRLADFLFAVHPIRKLYLRALEYSLTQYRSLVTGGHVTIEGVFSEYDYLDGRYWDLYTMSMDRAQFDRFRERYDRFH